MRLKYNNAKTIIDGITFHSKKEGKRYSELLLLAKSGAIKTLAIQIPFELVPSQTINGKKERAVNYIADFVYYENGNYIVEDCKGYRTEVYKLKRKLMKHVHNIEIRET